MSEVDRLSNSGLYPALPIADRRSSKDESDREPRAGRRSDKSEPQTAESSDPASSPRPPKSLIDEYA